MRHCEFRHLLVTKDLHPSLHRAFGRTTYLSHVHEDEALSCAYMERLGWPSMDA